MTQNMERPIDEIRKAETARQELLKAAAALENEVQRIKDYLQPWRQSIQ